ncbi:MAG: CHAT domain-containing protein, partial [Deltaproteobacteria bacterium]
MLASYVTHEATGNDSRVPRHWSVRRRPRSPSSRERRAVIALGGTSAVRRLRRMRFVPTLYAERLEGYIRYRLEVPERDAGLPLQEEFNHTLDQTTMLALRQSADALLRSEETSAFPEEARRRGSVLYRTLVPPRLRDQLKALSGPLLISTSLYGVPWELLHDDDEFWGLRYAMGKRIMMSRPLTTGVGAALRSRPRALVVGSDPRGDLPFVHSEVERICETLERFADICCVSGRLATFDAVTAYLREGFDLIHYCGHVLADRQGGPALLLTDETPLAAEVIEPNLAGRPLVFLNGCASARGAEHEPTGTWEERFSGVAYGFLFGGAVAVVGTLCDVSDRHAASLAEAFYERVLTPLPVGEALRGARERCRADPASARSPTWLSFVLYGNPGQVLLRPRTTEAATVGVSYPPAPAVLAGGVRPVAWWKAQRIPIWAGPILALALAAGFGYKALQSWMYVAQPQAPLVVGVM